MIQELLNKLNISMLVCSCDLYEDAWYPFFRLIDQNFPEHPQKMYLLTNNKSYQCDGLDIRCVHSSEGETWTDRVKKALESIEEEFILFSLEDFFIFSKVNAEDFYGIANMMLQYPKWGGVWFPPLRKGRQYSTSVDLESACVITDRLKKGRTNMGIILYRKSFLSKLLVEREDAWRFESESNIRSIFAGYEVIHYNNIISRPVFWYYQKIIDGVGITSRKWLDKTHEIFEINGIHNVNFSRLGTLSPEEAYIDPTDKRTHVRVRLTIKDRLYYYVKRPLKSTRIVSALRGLLYWYRYYR